MFYAPWCGHCKKAKPEYQAAADKLAKESNSKVFAAVDCTTNEGKDTAIPHTESLIMKLRIQQYLYMAHHHHH